MIVRLNMGIGEGTGKVIGGDRNENATVDVRSYEAGQDRKRKNKYGDNEVGQIAKEVQERRLKRYEQERSIT